MITITDAAAEKMKEFEKSSTKVNFDEGGGLRLGVIGGGCSGLSYKITLEENFVSGKDTVFQCNGIPVFIDLKSALYLEGIEIDYINELMESGFKITNPNAQTHCGCGKSFN